MSDQESDSDEEKAKSEAERLAERLAPDGGELGGAGGVADLHRMRAKWRRDEAAADQQGDTDDE